MTSMRFDAKFVGVLLLTSTLGACTPLTGRQGDDAGTESDVLSDTNNSTEADTRIDARPDVSSTSPADAGRDATLRTDANGYTICNDTRIYTCDPVRQLGCDSRNCVVDSMDRLTCANSGTTQQFQRCSSASSCVRGLICNYGTCLKPCCSTTDCNPGDVCGIAPTNLIGSCVRPCNWPSQECPGASTCYPISSTQSLCYSSGSIEVGSPCRTEGTLQCTTGAVCFDGICRQMCSTSSPTCSAGRCMSARVEFPEFPSSFGICVP